MKRIVIYALCSVLLGLNALASAETVESPKPFGLEIGKTSYADVEKFAQKRKWQYREYEKRQLREVTKQDPVKGKNTFLKITPRDLKDMRSILAFFNSATTLEAIIIALDPNTFEAIIGVLDKKYDLVTKSLHGEDLAADYPLVRWQQGNVYIELQKPGPYRVRLVYVDKLLYENYKDFLQKTYEPHRYKLEKRDWMKEL